MVNGGAADNCLSQPMDSSCSTAMRRGCQRKTMTGYMLFGRSQIEEEVRNNHLPSTAPNIQAAFSIAHGKTQPNLASRADLILQSSAAIVESTRAQKYISRRLYQTEDLWILLSSTAKPSRLLHDTASMTSAERLRRHPAYAPT